MIKLAALFDTLLYLLGGLACAAIRVGGPMPGGLAEPYNRYLRETLHLVEGGKAAGGLNGKMRILRAGEHAALRLR